MEELQMTFDGGDSIHCNRKCYFFDCGEVAQTISKIYNSIPLEGFISDDVESHGKLLNDRKIYSLYEILRDRNNFIIIATNRDVKKISARFESLGLQPSRDFCHYKTWIRKYLETLLREKNQLAQDYLELYITDRCSLKCKECILFAPYIPAPRDRDLLDLQRDVETYFRFIDRVAVFRLMGGEPFLYNRLEDLLTFISGGGGRNFVNACNE